MKRKTVVRQIPGSKTTCRVYVKGAPEYLFQLCNQTLNHKVEQVDFHNKDELLEEVVGKTMAGENCLKVLTYAFKEISLESFNELMHTYSCESAEFRSELETDLIYLGTFGVEDPLIDDIHCSVQLIRFGRILEDNED